MITPTKNIVFSVTTFLSEVVVEIGILNDVSTQEHKLFIKRIERDGHATFEDYASKTIDVIKSDERVSFFNAYDVPERLDLGDIECSLTNVSDEAILKANIWGETVSIKVPNVDAIFF